MVLRWLPVWLCLIAGSAPAQTLRIAQFHTELSRDGPGLLLRDILRDDEQVEAVVAVITHAAPDILLLNSFDWDLEGHAMAAFAERLSKAGLSYPHRLSLRPNSGLPSGVDLDGNGRTNEPEDAQGFGRFTGQGGMVILSRYPFGEPRDFSPFLWRDLPGHQAPTQDGLPFPSQAAQDVQRLSSVAHWDVPVLIAGTTLHLLAWHGNTPVFDGPEDLNGRRGADEALFWLRLLDGTLPFAAPEGPVILLGTANIDPEDGDGRHDAIDLLLADARLQDLQPRSPGGTAAANPAHTGDPALDTADFRDPEPGNLRVDYLLPDARLDIVASGVLWPAPGEALAETVATASRHRLIWADVTLP